MIMTYEYAVSFSHCFKGFLGLQSVLAVCWFLHMSAAEWRKGINKESRCIELIDLLFFNNIRNFSSSVWWSFSFQFGVPRTFVHQCWMAMDLISMPELRWVGIEEFLWVKRWVSISRNRRVPCWWNDGFQWVGIEGFLVGETTGFSENFSIE